MTFLNPFVLFGLVAAAIPVILHLLNLRKLRTIEFSTLTFLKELQQTKIRRLKLRQLLLLIVRTLLVICIVVAFARPALRGTILGGIGSQAHTTVVYIFDDSFSETATDEHGERFRQAKEATGKLIDLLKEGDEGYLIKLSDLPRATVEPAMHDFGGLRRLITEAQPSAVRHPMQEALQLASRLVAQSSNVNKEVYIISDMQRTLFEDQLPKPARQADSTSGPRLTYFIVPIGDHNISNIAIDSLRCETTILEKGKPATVKAWIRNYGDVPVRDYVVSSYLDGKRAAQRSVTLEAGGSASVEFAVTPKRTGSIKGYVEVENDNIDFDNRRYFSLNVPERVQIGIVSAVPADAQYILLALRAGRTDTAQSLISAVQTTPEKFPLLDLKTIDVLCCIDVPSFSAAEADRIRQFVENGGGLLLFPGNDMQAQTYNTTLLSALQIPPIEGVMNISQPGGEASFRDIDIDHPIFATMFEHEERRGIQSREIVESPAITRILHRQTGKRGHAIITLNNGTPFLSEHPLGSGNVLFYSVAPTLAWSDFPLKAIFAPLIFRSAMYTMSHIENQTAFTAGEEAVLKIHQRSGGRDRQYKIISPDSVEELIQQSAQSSPANQYSSLLTFQPKRFTLPGNYELMNGANLLSIISVNADRRESDTRKASEEELERFWRRMNIPPAAIKYIGSGGQIEAEILQSRFGVELWKYFVGAAILFALFEMLIARDSSKAIAQAAG